jgi:5-methylcytosine-specific restriction endonuclease McrA
MGLKEIRELKAKAKEPKEKKYYSIPKMSVKRKERTEEDKQLLHADDEFYKDIWSSNTHVCANCLNNLQQKFERWNFHHLLPKKDYPQFRHDIRNIVILCLECHSKCETDYDTIPKIRDLKESITNLLLP